MDHSSDRRRFLLSTLGATAYASPVAGVLLNSCKSTGRYNADLSSEDSYRAPASIVAPKASGTVRKSATDPSNKNNIALYSKAVAAMKATPFPILIDGQQLTWWEAHAEIHNTACPHGNWFFLPWHRGYLHHFELVCREFCGDASFALPYWDWSSDARLPEEFDVGDEKTNPLCNDTRSLSKREALDIEEISADSVNAILESIDFALFAGGPSNHPRTKVKGDIRGHSGELESGPHNRVHAIMQGDMGTFTSPRDPVFWLHHCNVDRLWSVWAERHAGNDVITLPGVENTANPSLTRAYWEGYKVDGYYSIKKEGEIFTAEPATIEVKGVVNPSSLGLSYAPPVKLEPINPADKAVDTTPQVPTVTPEVPTVPGEVSPPAVPPTENATPPVASPEPVVPVTPPIPLPPPVTETPLVPSVATAPAAVEAGLPGATAPAVLAQNKDVSKRWKAALRKTVILRTTPVKGFGLAGPTPGVINIDGSSELEFVLKDAAKPRSARSAALRLIVKNIPYPSDVRAELHFYLNAATPKGKRKNPGFIGAMSFFGHNHAGATVDTAFDLLPAVKKLTAAGQSPFGQAKPQPVKITAVWSGNAKNNDLSAITLSLDYLELLK